ncbi:MAG TPA: ABC transporter substrate-binding protein [Candidatus Binatia bacterium]|jgi:ABC-type nitrate/sulfonate/bicarbonate transport system substrate-binding protein
MKRASAIAVILAAAILAAAPAWPQEKIRLGLSSVSAIHSAVWVAEQKGLFRKHGLDPEIIVIGGAAPMAVSALLAGDIQFATAAGDAVINANLRGGDPVMVAGVINSGLQRLVARPEIKSQADIKGKKIGVTRIGAVSYAALLIILRRWGMTENDVQIVQVGSSPNMLTSLDKSGISAAVLTLPSIFVAEDRGYRTLADLADLNISYLHAMMVTTRSYLRAQRDRARRFLLGYLEGIAYFKQHKDESLDIVRKKLRIDAAQEGNLVRAYDLLTAKYYETIPYPSMKGVETVLGFVDNPKAKGADPKSFVDESLLRDIDASGYLKTLYEAK